MHAVAHAREVSPPFGGQCARDFGLRDVIGRGTVTAAVSTRVALLLLSALAMASGCYGSHERDRSAPDSGRDGWSVAPDALRVDAGHDAPPSVRVDGGPECAPIGAMVDVAGPHPYRIETTEVTQAAYGRFLRCGAPVEATVSCPSTDVTPTHSREYPFDPEGLPDFPIRWVSWCAATAYCAWADRRLCTREEWTAACLATQARMATSEGDVTDPRACVLDAYADGVWSFERGVDVTQPVRSAPSCRGLEPPFDEVFDMVGNVAELVTVDDGPEPSSILGGGFQYGPHTGCRDATWIDPPGTRATLGFRCCAD